jgi:hypothetical protein
MQTKENRYKHADEYGSYTVCFGDRTIEVKFVGFLSQPLLNKFCDDLGLMLRVIEWQFWGYYGDLSECDDKSAITGDVIVNLRERFLKHGCIVESYTITNPKSIESIVKLRMASGLEHAFLENNLFSDRHQAIEYIHKILSKVKKTS